ncbi:MAG TPA: ABC transporter ATP-binding protein [Selenomonadales bacterium]|nr:ABC transporter ATP-binding protein [Selenomonadales bacterium]
MLTIQKLIKEYRHPNGETIIAADIRELSVGQGEQLALAGPSGCGKTTLLHLIAGLASPTSGEIRWDGERIDSWPERKRDAWRAGNVGYIFQSFNLLPGLDVTENILVAAALGGRKPDAGQHRWTDEMLARVGLAERARHRPSRLSMGEQQRVAVIRALINSPRLILADEPTASLDRDNAAIILELLQALCREKGSMLILASHDRDVTARFERLHELKRPGRNPV